MLRLVISYHLLLLGVITPFCSRTLQCAIKILRLNFYGNFVCCFFYVCIIGMNWPLGITFLCFISFVMLYIHFYLITESLYFFLYFCCDLIFSSSDELFGFYEFLFFLIFLMLIYSLSVVIR